MGCLLGIFVYPFRFFRYCFTNGAKGYVVLGVVLVAGLTAFFIIRGIVVKPEAKPPVTTTTTTQAITGLPTKKEAPYLVTTPTRYYYALKAEKAKSGIVTMDVYWELIGSQWVKRDTTLELNGLFGEIKVTKRR